MSHVKIPEILRRTTTIFHCSQMVRILGYNFSLYAPLPQSLYSVIGIVTGLWAGRSGFDSWLGNRLLFLKTPRPASRPTQPPIQWTPRWSYQEVKPSGRLPTCAESPPTTVNSPPTSAESPPNSADYTPTITESPPTTADLPATGTESPQTTTESPPTSADSPPTTAQSPPSTADSPSTSVD
jgi:hypothetical protein